MKKHSAQTVQTHRPDFILLASVVALVLFGLLMVYNSSPVTSLRDFGDQFYLIRLQVGWAAIGLIFGIIVYKLPYSFWQKLSPLIILVALGLLVAVFFFGTESYGAQRWLRYGGIGLQPAEFAKFAYVIYLAAFLSKKVRLAPFLFISGIILAIVLAQRDLGTSIILSVIGIMVYFVSGASLLHFFALVPLVVIGGAVLIFSSAYRKARFLSFLDPTVDPQGISYHIYQVLLALGSGGWFGVGLGESRQKYGFIPEVHTDSIFAVIGNELGFVGSLVFISVYLLLMYRGFQIAKNAPDKFSHLVAVGVTTWLSIQALINIGGLAALIPFTGVPLPFVSYGGSSLVSALMAVGLLLNISKYSAGTNRSRK